MRRRLGTADVPRRRASEGLGGDGHRGGHRGYPVEPVEDDEREDAGVQVGFLRAGRLLGSEFYPMQARIEDQPGEILAGFVSRG